MKKRNLVVFLILSLITFGLYMLYWMYRTRQSLVEKTDNPKDIPPISYIFAPLLAVILVAVIQFWTGDSQSVIVTIVNILSAILGVAAIIATIVMIFVFIYRLCLTAAKVFETHDSTTIFWLWVLGSIFSVGPIGPILIQNHMNQYLDKHAVPVNDNPLSQPPAAPTV